MTILKRGHVSVDTTGMTIEDALKMIENHVESIRDFLDEGDREPIPSAIEQLQLAADVLHHIHKSQERRT